MSEHRRFKGKKDRSLAASRDKYTLRESVENSNSY
jgi:hypothetical protein